MAKAILSAVTASLCLSLSVAAALAEPAAQELRRTGELTTGAAVLVAPPSAELVRTRTLEWVAQRVGADQPRLEEIGKLWGLGDEVPTAQTLFELTIESFVRADEVTKLFVD